jgi:hypothetical protein
MMSRIDSRLWTISTGRHFQNGHHNTAKIQHCPISSKFDMWVDNDVPNWFATLKNFYRSPFSKWSMNFLLLFLQNRPSICIVYSFLISLFSSTSTKVVLKALWLYCQVSLDCSSMCRLLISLKLMVYQRGKNLKCHILPCFSPGNLFCKMIYLRKSLILTNSKGPLWSRLYGSWIYNYLSNQYLSPLELYIRTPFMARCTPYNIMW